MDVLRLAMTQGMSRSSLPWPQASAAAFAFGRSLTWQLYEISAHNPLVLGATVAALGIAALLACLFPALRACTLNPIALRVQ
jgi:hypothetical protein